MLRAAWPAVGQPVHKGIRLVLSQPVRAALSCQGDMEREVEAYLRRKHPAAISAVELVEKEDLDLKNHLSGLKRRLMKARPEPARFPT